MAEPENQQLSLVDTFSLIVLPPKLTVEGLSVTSQMKMVPSLVQPTGAVDSPLGISHGFNHGHDAPPPTPFQVPDVE